MSVSRTDSEIVGAVRTQGVRDAETYLFEEIMRLQRIDVGELAVLARPLRIIVPSRSLREHLSAALVRYAGRPVLGIVIHTLNKAARTILADHDEDSTAGEAIFPVLCRREAAVESALCKALGELEDGYGAVVGTVADLLDAGLDPALVPALDELLSDRVAAQPGSAALRRARELIAVASRVAHEMCENGLQRNNDLLRLAGERFADAAESVFPARAIFVYGFADVTGVAGDFLLQLVRYGGARVFIDLPPDPAERGRVDASVRFVQPLLERLATPATNSSEDRDPSVPILDSFCAPAAEDEFAELALRIRGLLVSGAQPEGIGVVLRDLSCDAVLLAAVFREEGIPFSGVGQFGESSAAGRFVAALRAMLRAREQLEIESWLELLEGLSTRGLPARIDVDLRGRLRVFLRDAGIVHVRDLVRFGERPDGKGDSALASRGSASLGLGRSERAGSIVWSVRRVALDHAVVDAVIEAGQAFLRCVEGWCARGPWTAHLAAFRSLLREGLGWENVAANELRSQISDLCGTWEHLFPDRLVLAQAEAIFLLDQLLVQFDSTLRQHFGGLGAGVQVLGAMEARGRSFEHLFVAGLNRDVFPRVVREDPLLPDWLRGVLAQLLPELALKQRGLDEERYLFTQLLASSPEVTLSWREQKEDGKEAVPSSLVARLEIEGVLPEAPRIRAREAPERVAEADGAWPRSAQRALRFAGLYGSREQVSNLLLAALEEQSLAEGLCAEPELGQIAAGRFEVLEEIDPDLRTHKGRTVRETPGPYLGFLGSMADEDPRRNPLYVTSLENLSRCPWKTLSERSLGLAPPPGTASTIDALDGKLRGEIVHEVLEQMVGASLAASRGRAGPKRLEELCGCGPVAMAWPGEDELQAVLRAVAGQKAAELGAPGWAGLLVAQCLPYLERAKALDWGGGTKVVPCMAVEIEGRLELANASDARRTLFFRADRVDRLTEQGRLRLIDYKTGRNFLAAARPETRRKHLLEAIRSGQNLQGAAYALASLGGQGSYLFLNPADPLELAHAAIADDEEIEAALCESVSIAWAGMETGCYFPRLIDAKGNTPKTCEFCEVREACRLGDSGLRMRLGQVVDAQRGAPGGDSSKQGENPAQPVLRSLLALWDLADSKETDSVPTGLLHVCREQPA